MTQRNAQSGFTMVEVLVALVVLAIGLLGIAALYLNSLQAGRTAVYRTEADYPRSRPRRSHPHEPHGPGRLRQRCSPTPKSRSAACATTGGC